MLALVLAAAVVKGDTGAKLDAYLKEQKYVGAVLVAKKDEVLLAQGYGLADREKGKPWTTDTYLSIGSITKQFTAAAILKLEAAGDLSVEDTIGKFWKDAPEDKRGITLHQLLTHTSGLASDFAGDYEPVGRDEYVKRILGSKLESEPGKAYAYANSGYSLLAAIVEIVSGKGYEAYLREALLDPAGMKETGYKLPAWDPARMPVGYREGERWGTMFEKPWAPDGPYWALRGNGGIETTLSDLLAWSRALDGDKVLPAAERKKLFTPWVREGPGAKSSYGYGWAIEPTPWRTTVVGHNGGNGIFSADFRRYVDDGIVVLAATNDSTRKATRVAEPLARIVRGETPAPGVTPLGDDARAEAIRAFVAAFAIKDPGAMRAFRDRYMASRPGGPTEEQRDEVTQRMRDEFETLRVAGVLAKDPTSVTTRMLDARGNALKFRFDFTTENKISGIGIERE
ncbi:MAG TPA: serine hydrolase domain-containing protein [Candidatus Polarisedimenticolaceae bacterium]|nr:serine hydrolase domain-containing protein [Candidatus Polarisedimenticolaceae bacterium]